MRCPVWKPSQKPQITAGKQAHRAGAGFNLDFGQIEAFFLKNIIVKPI
jgi:hypothetical protein